MIHAQQPPLFRGLCFLYAALQFLWCDMTIFPGNSGRPVVVGDNFAGIVSAQPSAEFEGDNGVIASLLYRLPFAMVVPADTVLEEKRKTARDAPKIETEALATVNYPDFGWHSVSPFLAVFCLYPIPWQAHGDLCHRLAVIFLSV